MKETNQRRSLFKLFHQRGAGMISRAGDAVKEKPVTIEDPAIEIADMTAAAKEARPSEKTKALLDVLDARYGKEVSS